MMKKQFLLALIPLLFVAATITNVYAGGPRHDYDERYEDLTSDIPGNQYERAYELAKDICDEDAEVDKSGGDCADAREAVVPLTNSNANATEEIIYDKDADLPICVYKVIQDCKVRSGLICLADTTIDPCQDIFHGFTGTDENYKPDTDQFIVP